MRDLNPICKFSTAPQLTDELIRAHTALVITQVRRRWADICAVADIFVHGQIFV